MSDRSNVGRATKIITQDGTQEMLVYDTLSPRLRHCLRNANTKWSSIEVADLARRIDDEPELIDIIREADRGGKAGV